MKTIARDDKGDAQQSELQNTGGEMDLATLLRPMWQRRVWVVGLTLLATCVAVVYAMLATEWYRAEIVLLPQGQSGGAGLPRQLLQFEGLASIAGIDLGQGSKEESLAVLRSKGFVTRFISNNHLLDELVKPTFCDRMGWRSAEPPDVRDAVERFSRSIMSVTEEKKTGLITVAIQWTDGAVAAKWANDIAKQLNDEMRIRALNDAGHNISYLKAQLETTQSVSLQQAIARLLETEMQKMMLAQGTNEYSLRVIDVAREPARRVKPKRTFVVLSAALLGMLVSALGAFFFEPAKHFVSAVGSP